jgi:O-methyltransferase
MSKTYVESPATESTAESARNLYLELMKKSLLNIIYGEVEDVPVEPKGIVQRQVAKAYSNRGIKLVRERKVCAEDREEGKDWPANAHTMIGRKRLDNLHRCIRDVILREVPGDLIETGVWRGGATIFMRAVLKAYGNDDRSVWVADSFHGLPPPNGEKYPADAGDAHHVEDRLRVTLDQVKANFVRYDLLDERVKFLKGWFSETLAAAPIDHLAVMRLDGDMYESTMDALRALYPRLSPGGYVIIDDFGYLKSCEKAVLDFRKEFGVTEPIQQIDWTGVFWQRSR